MISTQLNDILEEAKKKKAIPNVIAYNRIDGPGSSLDLREFQQALWRLPVYKNPNVDPAVEWSKNLPRTIGITINIGTKIEAHPFDPEEIAVESIEYGTKVHGRNAEIIPTKKNWLLKVLDIFDLKGVKFILGNLKAGTQSSGLGGSSTAIIGVCILANELAGCPFSPVQLISMSSRLEQELGVSITGTQEQSNVVYGGVRDYVWFPWGVKGHPESGYGESMRFELTKPENYNLLEQRMSIYHSGVPRDSADVNQEWRESLKTPNGFKLHSMKMEIAYKFREGLRLQKWDHVRDSIVKYRKIREKLSNGYMYGSNELLGRAEVFNGTAFPLGAGGGGGVFMFCPDPDDLNDLRDDLKDVYREIPFKILPKGHELNNLPVSGG